MFKELKILGLVVSSLLIVGSNLVKEFEVVEDFSIELGEELPSGVINYIKGVDQVDVGKEAELVLPEVEKEYLDLGDYTVGVKYREELKEVKVTVVDTVSPEFVDFIEEVETDYGVRVEWTGLYKATDLTDVVVSVDDSTVDYNKEGEYKASVTATDTSGNVATKEVIVKVKEGEKVVTTPKTSGVSNGNISNGKGISLRKSTLRTPTVEDFGKYVDYAIELCNIIQTQDTWYVEYYFNSHEEAVNFSTTLEDKVLPTEVCLYQLHYNATERVPETNEWIGIHKIIFDSNRLKDGMNVRKALSVSYDACILAGLKDGMSEKEAVNKISRWICNNMIYELNNGQAYTGFTTGRGQCHTYAQMFKSMCDTAGIECEYVSGYAGGGSHAWNRVKIGGNWYYVDTTWYDSNGKSTYLLSSTLWSTHKQN